MKKQIAKKRIVMALAWMAVGFFFNEPFILSIAEASSLFQPVVHYDVGGYPHSVATADLNDDTFQDLAVANFTGGTVSVLLGNGNGTFQSAMHYAAGSGPKSVAIGDLNDDGVGDLAMANSGDDTVSVLLGIGDGTFQSAVHHGTGAQPSAVAIAYLNDDEFGDLAVTNYGSDTVSVLLGIGDGTFQSAVHHGTGAQPSAVAIADLNGDDFRELAVTNHGSNTVSVLRGNGDGTFQSAIHYGAGSRPSAIAIADLNGDNVGDLALANWGSEDASILLGNGDGSFQSAVSYGAGDSPGTIAIDDLNGDGHPDLAVNCFPMLVSVLQGNGDGTFQRFEYHYAGEIPTSIAIDDFNGDCAPDLAVAKSWSDSVSILLNNGENFCCLAKKFDVGCIANGVSFYTDRNYYVTEGVPAWMEGRMLIKTPNDERFNDTANGYVRFKSPVSWWVYVLFDSRAAVKPDWLDGWELRSQYTIYTSLATQPHLEVWRKYYEADECVDLGGNFGPGASDENRSNYMVVFGKDGCTNCTLDPKFGETSMVNGAFYYADRTYAIEGGIPSWMIGRTLIQTPNDERKNNSGSGYIRFQNPESWWVYVLFDSRSSSVPAWLNGWEWRSQYRIYTTLETQPYLKVYCKWFEAGACVNLGGNYGAGASYEYRSNYSVVYGK